MTPAPMQSLADVVPSVAGKLLVTLLVLVAVGGVWRIVDRLHEHDSEAVPHTVRHFALSATSVVVTLCGGIVIIAVWGLTGPLVDVYRRYQVGPEVAVNAVVAVIIFATAYATTDLISRITRQLSDGRSAITEHQREIIYRLSQVGVYALAFIVVLGLFSIDLGGILVGAGFLGIVVGLAARQTLGALLAGFVLMFSRPFEIGDWVEIGEYEGIVTDITIVNTRMQTFDGEYVMVPNDVVSSESVVNRSRKGRLRIEVDVGVDYETDTRHAADVATDAVRGLDEILRVPTPQVVVKSFADSAVLLGVRVWIDNPSARRKWRARTAVVAAVKEAFDEEGIKIPFPQRELMGRSQAGGLRVTADELRGVRAEAEPTPDGGVGSDERDGDGREDASDADSAERDEEGTRR